MKIKIRNILILIVIFMLFAAILTNPKKDYYISWFKNEMSTSASSQIEKGIVALLGGPIIENSTSSRNYIFFSIYDTTINNEKLRVIGIFNNFIPINKVTVRQNNTTTI